MEDLVNKLNQRKINVKMSQHAQERMAERNIRLMDIMEALKAGNAKPSKGNMVVRNKVSSRSDYPLQVVYSLDTVNRKVVVVSCYWKGLND